MMIQPVLCTHRQKNLHRRKRTEFKPNSGHFCIRQHFIKSQFDRADKMSWNRLAADSRLDAICPPPLDSPLVSRILFRVVQDDLTSPVWTQTGVKINCNDFFCTGDFIDNNLMQQSVWPSRLIATIKESFRVIILAISYSTLHRSLPTNQAQPVNLQHRLQIGGKGQRLWRNYICQGIIFRVFRIRRIMIEKIPV